MGGAAAQGCRGSLTCITAVRPSLTYSPPKFCMSGFRSLYFLASVLIVLVSAVFSPSTCVPPSVVFTLFT